MYKLLIFDWDGTLIDSAGRIVSCMQRAAADLNYPALSDAAVRNIIGLGLPEALQVLIPDIDSEGIQAMRQRYGDYFFAEDEPPSQLFATVAEELQQLHDAGYVLAVATGKSRRGLKRAFLETGLDELFLYSRCADETRSKPHPLMLHEVLAEAGMSADQALMIGDTEYDLEMAQNAGMHSLGVSYGAHNVERLAKHRPIAIIDHFSELRAHLAQREA